MKFVAHFFALVVVTAAQATPDAFFSEYCLRCHDADKQKGDFRLDNLPRDFGDELIAQDWDEVLFRINSGEMPPEDEPQPAAAEVDEVVEWISSRIEEGRAARMSRRGPVALYRLSRDEYAHTVYDLLGVHFDVKAPGAFNEDPRWHGFDRVGSLLSLSPSHIERYFEAAREVVESAFPAKPPQITSGRIEANDARAQTWKEDNNVAEAVRILLLPGVKSKATVHAREAGLYKIRVQLSAIPSFKGRLPHLIVWDDKVKRSLFGQDVSALEDKPEVLEFEAYLPAGRHHLMNEAPGVFEALTLSLTNQTPFTTTKERRFTHPSSYKLYNAKDEPIFPMAMIDWVEWEGPLTPEADLAKREGLFPTNEEAASVRASLTNFAERAWRRPAAAEEIDKFVNVFEAE
ncbi:MAG: DUF1587 domain-containing protein, partial [Verrucomicrobiota bacterium]